MKSITAEKLRLDYEPVAILWSDTKPEGALQIKPHAQTCIMPFFAQVATKKKTAVFDRESMDAPVPVQDSVLATGTTMPSVVPVLNSWPHSL